MRRNYTASAALSHQGAAGWTMRDGGEAGSSGGDGSPGLRRNTSEATLCELRRREQSAMSKSDAPLNGSRAAVVEAVACRMLEHILGPDAALSAMRIALAATASAEAQAPAAAAPGEEPLGNGRRGSLSAGSGSSGEAAGGASSSSASVAEDEARLAALSVPSNISTSVQVRTQAATPRKHA